MQYPTCPINEHVERSTKESEEEGKEGRRRTRGKDRKTNKATKRSIAVVDWQTTSRDVPTRQFRRKSKMQVTVCLSKLPSIYIGENDEEEIRKDR